MKTTLMAAKPDFLAAAAPAHRNRCALGTTTDAQPACGFKSRLVADCTYAGTRRLEIVNGAGRR